MTKDKSTTIAELKDKIAKFRDERDWNKYHNPKNLVMAIAIETAELMEYYVWKTQEEADKLGKSKEQLQEIQEELADILIYCLALADRLNIDISQAIIAKLEKNSKKYPKDNLPDI